MALRLLTEYRQQTTAILEYRNAKAAVELFNGGREGAEELNKHPELLGLLVDIRRAQNEN